MADMYHLNLHLSNVVVMCLNFLHGRNYHDGYILLVYRLQFAQTLTWAAGTCCWGQAFGLYHRSGGAICYIYIYTFVGEKHASIRMDSGEQSDMVCIKHETRIVVSILDIWFLNIFVCIYTQIGQFESWSVRFSCWQFFLWSSGETCDYSTVQVEANITHLISWTDITLVYLGTFNHQNSFTQANWSFCIAPLPIGRK